ncbi:MAG: DUF1987 domain-containing protein [Tenuifilaceae bacterium]|jgi:hypothetical protein|nr:DUF1987 domain-containing protein [Tenuifilaceae bacterium]
MNKLFIKGTSKTPEIDFAAGIIQISGRSIPEDVVSFYQPVIKWIENYIENPEKFTKVSLSIEYINSGSNRFIFNILKLLEECYQKGHNVSISWYFEEDDDTIKNLGLDFKALFSVPFNLIIIT